MYARVELREAQTHIQKLETAREKVTAHTLTHTFIHTHEIL